jgi:GNAT superfamily N-acetyltransferase
MPAEVLIRPYQPSDQPGIEWLYSRTPPWGRTYPRPQPVPEHLTRIEEVCQRALVAVEQDRAGEAIVGFLALTQPDSPEGVPAPEFIDLSRPATRIHWLLVAPERWRHGIGRRLVGAALDWSRGQGFATLMLDTTADQEGAVAFYLAMGFHEAGRTRFRDWEIVWFVLPLLQG